MRKITILLLLAMISLTLNSCSLFFGGLVALDNSINVGEKEVEYEKLIRLRDGTKIILELEDSTKVSGTYKDHYEIQDGEDRIKFVIIADENGELKSINTSKIDKYKYVDEGGNVWTAAAIGGALEALMIYSIIKNPKIGGAVKVF